MVDVGQMTQNGSQGRWLVCHGCVCLRPAEKFGDTERLGLDRMVGWWGLPRRFCLECGRRPLPGGNRYKAGDSWREEGKLWVRCGVCEGVKETTEGMEREWVGEGRMGWITKTVGGAVCCDGCWG